MSEGARLRHSSCVLHHVGVDLSSNAPERRRFFRPHETGDRRRFFNVLLPDVIDMEIGQRLSAGTELFHLSFAASLLYMVGLSLSCAFVAVYMYMQGQVVEVSVESPSVEYYAENSALMLYCPCSAPFGTKVGHFTTIYDNVTSGFCDAATGILGSWKEALREHGISAAAIEGNFITALSSMDNDDLCATVSSEVGRTSSALRRTPFPLYVAQPKEYVEVQVAGLAATYQSIDYSGKRSVLTGMTAAAKLRRLAAGGCDEGSSRQPEPRPSFIQDYICDGGVKSEELCDLLRNINATHSIDFNYTRRCTLDETLYMDLGSTFRVGTTRIVEAVVNNSRAVPNVSHGGQPLSLDEMIELPMRVEIDYAAYFAACSPPQCRYARTDGVSRAVEAVFYAAAFAGMLHFAWLKLAVCLVWRFGATQALAFGRSVSGMYGSDGDGESRDGRGGGDVGGQKRAATAASDGGVGTVSLQMV